jgi:hypothetical protein
MSTTKAVIFTHLGMTPEYAEKTREAGGRRDLMNRVAPIFREYLRCRNVGLVYVYVDVGTQLLIQRLSESVEGRGVSFSLEELGLEERTRNCLKLAVDEVTQNLLDDQSIEFHPAQAPRFQFVGLSHLLSLFNALYRIDPQLIRDLAGKDQVFTYDSPKFVEAVIRLRRSPHPIHGRHPIFRFDADVMVNQSGIGELIAAVTQSWTLSMASLFNLFSGGYGRADAPPDPLNDYAVRLYWLVDRATGELSERGLHFLRDLGEIGATQVPSSVQMSAAMSEYVRQKRGGRSSNRKSQQVISGAGLFISQDASRSLPPFMNSRQMTTWIDDHLKRLLHEAVGHLDEESPEHLSTALFGQDRHPYGINEEYVKGATNYFPRILRGCLLHALIMEADGKTPGPLSREVREVIANPEYVVDEAWLAGEMFRVASERARDVLSIWKEADYGDTPLRAWAAKSEARADEYARSIVADALAYLRLVKRWPVYVQAIERLTPDRAYWLFRRVE